MATEAEVYGGTNKIEKARNLGIPIVSEDFISKCIEKGRIVKHDKFLLE